MRITELRTSDGRPCFLVTAGSRIREAKPGTLTTNEERIAGASGYCDTYIVENMNGETTARVPAWMVIAIYGVPVEELLNEPEKPE